MFSVTNHAVRRYSERILGLELDKEEFDDVMRDMGADIVSTITDMLRNSDLIFAQNTSKYFLYRNIALVVKDDCVITLYEIHNELDDLQDYINHINKTRKIIHELSWKHQTLRFEKREDDARNMHKRLQQYENWFFNSNLAPCE